jgi:Cu-processing system permease protein
MPQPRIIQAIASLVIKELYRRKDFYVLYILMAVICLVFGSISFFNEDRIVRYLKEICLGLIWLASLIIAITTAARQIPAECESRTISPLLAKPVSRTEFLLGKFLGCWLACGVALLAFYLFFSLVAASREHVWPILNYAQAMGMHWLMLAIVIAMTLLGSLVTAAVSSNVTISFLTAGSILFLGRHLNKIALQQPEPLHTLVYGVYYAIPHLEFYDLRNLIIHNWDLVGWKACLFATSYALVYCSFFLSAACWLFRRKPLN